MNKIEFGDCRDIMRRWATEGVKVQTCVTSPPYYGLRDYGTATYEGGDSECKHTISGWSDNLKPDCDRPERDGKKRMHCVKCGAKRVDRQLGLEQTPEDYIANMVEVFRCVKDILADDGTLWVNIGDTYSTHGSGSKSTPHNFRSAEVAAQNGIGTMKKHAGGLPEKNLIGIPWMLAFALRADGWILRQDIIWHKPNPMPESVQDRCTKAHEYIFLLSKSQKYFYDADAIKEDATSTDDSNRNRDDSKLNNTPGRTRMAGLTTNHYESRNKRSVWSVPVKPYSGAHFAVFPQELIEPCIMAGSRVGDTVLDPFMGSGTTAQVAQHLGRQYLGCELNPEYEALQFKRVRQLSLELI